MIILGINDGHDAGVALLEDGIVRYAVNEERFNRKKMAGGFPSLCLDNMLNYLSISPRDIKQLFIGNTTKPTIPDDSEEYGKSDLIKSFLKKCYYRITDINPRILDTGIIVKLHQNLGRAFRGKRRISNYLRDYGFRIQDISFVDHQLCHISSATGTAGFEKCLAVSLDGGGDGLSGSVYYKQGICLIQLARISKANSLGLFWAAVTEACGFNPNQHGGKITGLAALGDSSSVYDLIKNWYCVARKPPIIINKTGFSYDRLVSRIKTLINKFSMQDVAAAAQRLLEEVVVDFIKRYCAITGARYIALAGGIFANVRLNQKIADLPDVDEIFIHPNMGDGGKAIGAAISGYCRNNPTKDLPPISNAYLGNHYTLDDIESLFSEFGLSFYKTVNAEYEIAKLLNINKVVCRYSGRSEYGPRALGNRSILYHPKDVSVNDWLNKKLKRTEFMPFAPSVLKEYEDQCFFIRDGSKLTDHFMTRTFDCTDWFKEHCPAVVHVDGTSRPQIVTKEANTSYYKIIDEYRKLSGVPAILNTSFNMHEEPIVETPRDAIQAFISMRADYLAMGKYLVSNHKKK